MAVKPDPVNDLLPDWASNGNFDVGVYGLTLPWNAPNPLAGQPFPWGNQPRNNTANFTSFCQNGLVPQVATDASSFNEWQRRLGVWGVWVSEGSSDPDADAHIMETDVDGFSASVKHCATGGFFGALFASAPLPAGAIISDNMQLELLPGASVEGDETTSVSVGTLAMVIGAPPPAADGQTSVNADGLPIFRSDGAGRFTQGSVVGSMVEIEDDQVPATVAAATTYVTTGQTFIGLVRIIVSGEVQRGGAGDVRIAIAENSSGGFVDIDNGGVTFIDKRAVDTIDAANWTPFHMERTIGVGTVALARLDIQSGTTARVRETYIKVRRLGV